MLPLTRKALNGGEIRHSASVHLTALRPAGSAPPISQALKPQMSSLGLVSCGLMLRPSIRVAGCFVLRGLAPGRARFFEEDGRR